MERRRQQRHGPPNWHGVTFTRQGREERHLGAINDLCEGGLGLFAGVSFPPSTILELILIFIEEEAIEIALVGEVRWCVPDHVLMETYHLGISSRLPVGFFAGKREIDGLRPLGQPFTG